MRGLPGPKSAEINPRRFLASRSAVTTNVHLHMTHIGKIGRLPKCYRDELGRRIEDGEPGHDLVAWLNGVPRVQEILQEQFGGRPLTEQNLSEGKQTGHWEGLRLEATRRLATRLAEQSDDLDEAAHGPGISDRLACVLAAELARWAMTLLEQEADPEKRWQRLAAVPQQLSQLRRDDPRAVRTAIQRQKGDQERQRAENEAFERLEKARRERLQDRLLAPLENKKMADCFGGGAFGQKLAEKLHRINFDLPLDDSLDPSPAEQPNSILASEKPNKSAKIQANPT